MKRNVINISFSFAVIIFSAGCYYDNKETFYPSLKPCDSSVVTYSKNISTIMSEYCTSCHGSGPNSMGGIDLSTYAGVSAKIDRVYGCVNYLSGYSPMPKNGVKLDDCRLIQIKKWKDLGAQNN